MKKRYGLIGYPLSHSFSKKYFVDKFRNEGIIDSEYDLFEIEHINSVNEVFEIPNLRGINVTIPYKHDIMKYMDSLDHSAQKVGAVNVVKIGKEGKKTGFNSDYYGFKSSLERWLPNRKLKALVLGIGGAASAVIVTLEELHIPFLRISRSSIKGDMTYQELNNQKNIIRDYQLIINTTPLGMSPNTETLPELHYDQLTNDHYLYDLIYNPPETKFLREGKKQGAQIKNGLEMLQLQAEKSWEIWNQ